MTSTLKMVNLPSFRVDFGKGWFYDCTLIAILGFILGWNTGWIMNKFF
jgi:hypothetical protein